jgi:radical SAM protein with 4Fe4S-binding SPASM domain
LQDFFDDAISLGLRHVKFTGGEPMVYRDFKVSCDYFASHNIALWIETNGIRIDGAWARYFAEVGAEVGLSLDDVDPRIHDEFRKRDGSWEATVSGAREMIALGVRVGVTSCLTGSNLQNLQAMTEFVLNDLRAEHIAFNPILEFGRSRDSSRDWPRYLDEMLDRYETLVPQYGRDRLVLNLPVAFTTTAFHQACHLGDEIISVLADGSISICGFGIDDGQAIRFGDARTDRLSSMWNGVAGIQHLRSPGHGRLKGVCGNCVFVNSCRGYCRAQALSAYGDVDAPYPICQHAAERGKFPVRYLVDPDRAVSYEPTRLATHETDDLLPKGATQVQLGRRIPK